MSTLEWKDRTAACLVPRMVAFALLCAILGAAPLLSQDVAEAARQAREHKNTEANAQRHVYSEEDLKRSKILTPEDDSRVASHKPAPSAPQEKSTEPQVAEQKPVDQKTAEQKTDSQSLGEMARRYRAEKLARQAEQAAKTSPPSRFPLDAPANALASPEPLVAPARGSLRADELNPLRKNSCGTGAPPCAPPVTANDSAQARMSRPQLLAPALGAYPLSSRTVTPVPRDNFASRLSPFAPRNAVVPRNPRAETPLAVLAGSAERRLVQPGDSWWKLASRYLGKGSRWEELLRVNPGVSRDPNRLPAGTFVFVPGGAQAKAAALGAQITVKRGDTLWSLAREHLGSGQLWPQLATANPQVTQFNKLQIGAKLNLPRRTALPAAVQPSIFPQN